MNIADILPRLINATPHAITIRHGGADHVIQPSGITIRLDATTQILGDGVVSTTTSAPSDLVFDPTSYYFVSGMVAAAQMPAGFQAVYAPTDSTYLVRNDKGHTVAILAVQVKVF